MTVLLAALPQASAPQLLTLLLRFIGVTAGSSVFFLLAAYVGSLVFCRRPKE